MKATKTLKKICLSLTAFLFAIADAPAQKTASFVGTYRIDLPAHSSISTESRRIDQNTVEKTTHYRTGVGAKNAGTVEIRADGSYRIYNYFKQGSVKTGKWEINDEGPFSDKGGIELLEVKTADYGADQRSWYIYFENGKVKGREPPYTGFNDLRLTPLKGGPLSSKTSSSSNQPSDKQPAASKINQPLKGTLLSKNKTYTQEEIYQVQRDITKYFMDKTQAEVEAVLGKPTSKGDPDGYSQTFSLENIQLPIANYPANYKTITLYFDMMPGAGGKVKNVNVGL